LAINESSKDIELLQRVALYDSKALEVLYNRYYSLLFTLIKKIVGEQALAENVLIDVFVIIWRKVNHFDFNTQNVYSWLIILARNKAVDALRRKRSADKVSAGQAGLPGYTEEYENDYIIPKLSQGIDPLDLNMALNVKDSVETALNKLTDAQQYVIYLAFYEGLTQQEIAAKLNIPFPTVKSKIKIALSNLRENLIRGEV
jgi:RNA polymerase sigma-70 factor, ECF subfamily